jgi:predicted RNA-binding Zn ribbon-like protein
MGQPGGRSPAPRELELAQDLANTIDIELDDDRLTTPSELADFARRHGIVSRFTRIDVERCRTFREALREICAAHAGATPSHASVTTFNELLARAPIIIIAGHQGEAAFAPSHAAKGSEAVLAAVAAGVAESVARGTWPRLKACEATGCRWVYFDRSPAGRSRWCTMKICGSRAKARAFRERTRASDRRYPSPRSRSR